MSSAAIEEAREARHGLIFDWALRKGRPFWLFLFIVLSVFGHAAAFYLFQVVYPPQKRELLRPVEVTVLDPRDPLSRHVLSRIDDRVIAFDARATLEIPGEETAASAVRFHPYFEGYEPALRELPPLGEAPGDLFVPGELYLPSPAGARFEKFPPAAQPAPVAPSLQLDWAGEVRVATAPFVWAPDVVPPRPEDIDHAIYYLGIDATGRVAHCLADQKAGGEMDALLIAALEAMRFAGAPGSKAVDWVWARIYW